MSTLNVNLTPQEKEQEISAILDRGLVRPKTLRRLFKDLLCSLGLRALFWDCGFALLVATVTLAGIVFLLAVTPIERSLATTFTLAPLLFLATQLSCETAERLGELYELKRTCKYTIRQITAFRVLTFSLVGVIFCVGLTAFIAESTTHLVQLLPLALSGLFLCALFSLFLARRLPHTLAGIWAGAIWIVITLTPLMIAGPQWEILLSNIPVLLTICTTIVSAALFLREITKLAFDKEDHTYAYGQSRN